VYEEDLHFLRCPKTKSPLTIAGVSARSADGEIIEGELIGPTGSYPISNGIPRFVRDISYNESWDFKWRVLDGGRAFNYRIIDKTDPAYAIHDIFDRNDHGGPAYKHARGRVALDVGCGIGQYSVKLAQLHDPRKIVSVDLTAGIDIFRRVLHERYPELNRRFLLVQASVFELPFSSESFDYVFSLGVLMHTGNTLKALDNVLQLVRDGGEMNIWLYCSEPVAYDAVEPNRGSVLTVSNVGPFLRRTRVAMFWIHLFRRINHGLAISILKFMSAEAVYRLSRIRGFRWIRSVFPMVEHPDAGYRLINLYDGYVNNWCDTWAEHEIFPTLRKNDIAILGMSGWRLGIWGRKDRRFYDPAGNI
jgi:SAM-dependent methyltransferase